MTRVRPGGGQDRDAGNSAAGAPHGLDGPEPAPLPHLVLVGLPGAGKSTVGALAASALGSEFLDFDVEIQHRTRMTIGELFAQIGESAFREMEHELTREVLTKAPMVLAPGGGWVTIPANLALARPVARIIHLKVGVDRALRRLGSAVAARPLLASQDPRKALSALWKAREPIYREADAEIDTEVIDSQSVTTVLLALAATWGWRVG
ncbi:MAG TPA: shikimate kinase [Gemmatimonadaceae bacterium]|nr:shikimate kinase [Gemmatimonadaceae bacterium]